MRKAELVVAAALLLLSGVLLGEAVRLGIGWSDIGPGSGFVPFWFAAAISAAALGILVQQARTFRAGGEPFFPSKAALLFWIRVAGPMIAVGVLVRYLGLYIVGAIYLFAFSFLVGRHRWFVALGLSVIIPLVLYFGFERFFKLPLPKSLFYGDVIPF